MMWRGEMFSTLLHGSIVVAIVGGLPLLPNIFDRTEEPETESALGGGSSELPISIEIVSANSVDLQQNVITRRNRGVGQPAPPVASSKLQPQITGRPDATAQPKTASPAQNGARPSLPDAALNRPDTDRAARNRVAALPKKPAQQQQAVNPVVQKNASQPIRPAQYNLAGKFLRGEDTPKDMAAALKWLSRAAEQGYAPAQTLLGLMKFTGLGVKQDQTEAAFWWSLAAKAGDEGAKTAEAMIQNLLKPSELAQSKRLRARWGSLITDLADITAGDSNRRDLDGALRAASEKGDLDAVLSLLARGADPDKPGDEGRNAVINAA